MNDDIKNDVSVPDEPYVQDETFNDDYFNFNRVGTPHIRGVGVDDLPCASGVGSIVSKHYNYSNKVGGAQR
jgi:hypothetical protein